MLIEIDTPKGKQQIRLCDYCKTVCIPHGRFCSPKCYHSHLDAIIAAKKRDDLIEKKDGTI